MEQLGADADDQLKMLRGSQVDYTRHMEALNDELAKAWNQEQRVRALKMAIQCAKMLGDTSVPHFYPAAFVLITEILDTWDARRLSVLTRGADSASWCSLGSRVRGWCRPLPPPR